jgi:hypothetical protein
MTVVGVLPDQPLVIRHQRSWQRVKNEFPTWGDVKALNTDWFDVLWAEDPAIVPGFGDSLVLTGGGADSLVFTAASTDSVSLLSPASPDALTSPVPASPTVLP